MKNAVLALSGGMDSSTLLLHLLDEGYTVMALSFDYGQKHKIELERAADLVRYINNMLLLNSDINNMLLLNSARIVNPILHRVIKIDGLIGLLNSTLVEGGADVPEGHYAEENQRKTVVPNRNKIFSSIIQAVALSIATANNTDCIIALGIHAGDFGVYPDCRQEFRDADFKAFRLGNWEAERVSVYTPYLEMVKYDILKEGLERCKKLNLDFDKVYTRTNTSYKPVQVWFDEPGEGRVLHTTGLNSGRYYKWYSDYKSASSIERVEAFLKLDRVDPVEYADENGPVDWVTVVKHVTTVLQTHGE